MREIKEPGRPGRAESSSEPIEESIISWAPRAGSDGVIVARKPGNAGGAKGPTSRTLSSDAGEPLAEKGHDGRSGRTTRGLCGQSGRLPVKLFTLRQKLYVKAKREPTFRFYDVWMDLSARRTLGGLGAGGQ